MSLHNSRKRKLILYISIEIEMETPKARYPVANKYFRRLSSIQDKRVFLTIPMGLQARRNILSKASGTVEDYKSSAMVVLDMNIVSFQATNL